MVNHWPETVTGSLKLTVMVASTRTLVANLPGVVPETKGAVSPPPPPPVPVEERGVGAVIVKSALLLSVSTLPPPFLSAAVLLERLAVLAPSKQLAEVP